MIRVSVPGKIHLIGEHSIVYGKPALISAINLRIYVTIFNPDSLGAENLGEYKLPSNISNQQISQVQKTVENIIKKKFGKKIPPYKLSIKSEFPIGVGLGSSASLSAALSAAILSILKIKWTLDLINELTYEAEKVFHGNPSGGDNTTVVYGGIIWFKKGFERVKVNKNFKQFILINSGKPVETTKEMVELVRKRLQVTAYRLEKVFDEQERLTKRLAQTLKDGNEDLLIEIIKKAERNLEKLGVVGKKAQGIIRKIEKLGGAAKISGAGGVKKGSGMLLIYHKNPKKVLDFAKNNNREAFRIKIGEEGLRA